MKILVVEDDKESRDLLCEVLSGSHYAVNAVENVTDARRELSGKNDYCIVIADFRMPDGTGLELLRDIGRRNLRPGVILISSFMSGWERKAALELGARALLEKPFRFGDLLQAVANLAAPDPVGMVS